MATAAAQHAGASLPAASPSAAAASAWLSYISRASQQGVLLPTPEEASALCSQGYGEIVATYVYSNVEATLRTQHAQAFWARLQACTTAQPAALEAGLITALQGLASAVQAQSALLLQLSQTLMGAAPGQCGPSAVAALVGLCGRHRMAVSAVLISGAPFSLTGLLHQYYQHKLSMLSASMREQEDAQAGTEDADSDGEQQREDEDMVDQENEPPGAPVDARAAPAQLDDLGPEWAERLQTIARCLRGLGLDAASEEAYTLVVNSQVAEQLQSMAHKVFDTRVLPAAQRYVASAPLEFLKLLLGSDESDTALLRLNEWQLRLTYFMLETLGQLRIKDMFDIIVDYPDSAPAVADMGECLRHTNLHAAFVREVREAVRARLLHAGAATGDIITTYVASIRALREIDPSGMLLDAVAAPIRMYLRSRADTIRCIVAMLTEDTDQSLLEELEGGSGQVSGFGASGAVQGSGLGGGLAESEGDEAALRMLEAMAAAPPGAAVPGAAPAPAPSGGRSELDIVAMLIGIYGSKELFISEYRSSLALRLLAKADYECSREVRTLELLKIRFGEAGLHNCEVMIKDLGDSKRLNQTIRRLSPGAVTAPGAPPGTTPEAATAAANAAAAAAAAAVTSAGQFPDAAAASRAAEAITAALEARVAAEAPAAAAEAAATAAAAAAAARNNEAPDAGQDGALGAFERLHATVASYLFWPELQEHEMHLPPDMAKALELYADRYHHVKAPRKLLWRPTLGLVELEVIIGDSEPLEFSVTPVHAAILLHFSGQGSAATGGGGAVGACGGGGEGTTAGSNGSGAAGGGAAGGSSAAGSASTFGDSGAGGVVSASASALATALGVPQAVVRRKALFWVNNGMLLESRSAGGEVVYRRAEALDPSRALTLEATDMSWQADTGAGPSAEEKLIAEMSPFENFIIGILTNFSALPLDRMHSLLRMFVVGEPKYDKSQEQLAAFLQVMVAREKVDLENGIYKRRLAS